MSRTKSEETIKTQEKPLQGFFSFVSKYSIIGMSIGIVIGQTTKDTVNALVTGVITPAIQLLLPNTELQNLVVNVNKAEFQVGLFLNAIIEMLIILGVLYLVVGILLRRADLLDKK